jgi:hypothetical protein
MLVTPRLKFDPHIQLMLNTFGQGGLPIEIETGIFISPSFSFGNNIADACDKYTSFENDEGELSAYGVCDTVEQVKQKYAQWLDDPSEKYCIAFTLVTKDSQPERYGWRWHKWGEYIGDKSPQHEYLYDEDDSIQEVYCYHIYKILE